MASLSGYPYAQTTGDRFIPENHPNNTHDADTRRAYLAPPVDLSTTPPAGKLRKTSKEITTTGEHIRPRPSLPREILLQIFQDLANAASAHCAFLDLLSASMSCTEWYSAARVLLPASSLRDHLS
ncbi:hypothetical protein BC938DRAFT_477005 [Jimgerdemannia flammicorona]|uniref:F-box domain-containing protein n=1 Tax=Jimgerdemannia flammicorona TaxID=994334 RepID=A0A433QZ42_9FUNG|nr:hypothetical protein BC938DRAFT_477005 [Jimgerdemannia flammicorona]